jgi:hypothetical protein
MSILNSQPPLRLNKLNKKYAPRQFPRRSVKSGRDAAGTLSSALATATLILDGQVRDAESPLATFRVATISHPQSISKQPGGSAQAVVTAAPATSTPDLPVAKAGPTVSPSTTAVHLSVCGIDGQRRRGKSGIILAPGPGRSNHDE